MPRTTIRSDDITDAQVKTVDMAVDPTNASNLSSGSVPTAQLGNVDTSGLEADIALLAFKTQANGNLARYSLVDQFVDAFEDATGVDASASTDELRDATGKYYHGGTLVNPVISGNYQSATVDGDYTYYKWTTVTSSGSYTTDTAQDYEYLVVAGGGGAGGRDGGGAGAGGYRTATGFAVAATTISNITVGAGGAGGDATNYGPSGGNSIFSTITSAGGGGGGGSTVNPGTSERSGQPGGSGGGAGAYFAPGSTVAGAGNTPSTSPAQGYAGGIAFTGSGSNYQGGGGGGASVVGAAGITAQAGAGGNGTASSITGSAVTYAGGGGGGSQENAGQVGAGGTGGGGSGSFGETGVAGTANTGGGGGGGGAGHDGGAGGEGIVIIRRLTTATVGGGNMSLVSTTTAAQAAPTKGDIVFTYTNGTGTAVLGTNVTAEVSADGGSTWTSFGVVAGDTQGTTGGHTIVSKSNVTLTSTITSPYNMAYRIKTLVQSAALDTRIHAVSLGWS